MVVCATSLTACGGGGSTDGGSDVPPIDGPRGDGATDPDGATTPDAFVPLGYHSLATGTHLSCDLAPDGAAACWGAYGNELGETTHASPVAAGGGMKFTQLSAYGRNVCGVTAANQAYCWGPNGNGQLGTGGITDGSQTPALVGTGREFSKVYAGDATACAITPEQVGYCWGDNPYGQVGASVTGSSIHSPVIISGLLHWLVISPSANFTCGVATDRAAYCWGSDLNGQLGNGGAIGTTHANDQNEPAAVAGGMQWQTVTTGRTFACGLTMAGAAYCWGENGYRLGSATTAASSAPVAVTGGHVFTSIDAGRDFACALTATGDAYCWGADAVGQLATGTTNAAGSPVLVPTHVALGHAFAEISASDGQHACGATLDHDHVFCWGGNDVGQLGTGAVAPSMTTRSPTPIEVTH